MDKTEKLQERLGALTILELWNSHILGKPGWIRFIWLTIQLIGGFELQPVDEQWLSDRVEEAETTREQATDKTEDEETWPVQPN